jgi:hypothetical protein
MIRIRPELNFRWDKVVRNFNLNEEDNILFRFHEKDDGEQHLLVETFLGQY